MSCDTYSEKKTYEVTDVTLEPLCPVFPTFVTSKLIWTISLLKALFQFKYFIIDALQICSTACHISAHLLCAFVEGEVSSSLEGDVIKEKVM